MEKRITIKLYYTSDSDLQMLNSSLNLKKIAKSCLEAYITNKEYQYCWPSDITERKYGDSEINLFFDTDDPSEKAMLDFLNTVEAAPTIKNLLRYYGKLKNPMFITSNRTDTSLLTLSLTRRNDCDLLNMYLADPYIFPSRIEEMLTRFVRMESYIFPVPSVHLSNLPKKTLLKIHLKDQSVIHFLSTLPEGTQEGFVKALIRQRLSSPSIILKKSRTYTEPVKPQEKQVMPQDPQHSEKGPVSSETVPASSSADVMADTTPNARAEFHISTESTTVSNPPIQTAGKTSSSPDDDDFDIFMGMM